MGRKRGFYPDRKYILKANKKAAFWQLCISGAPKGIWTPDTRFRKPLLYPAELWTRVHVIFYHKKGRNGSLQIKWNERDKTGKWFSFLPMSERKEIIFSFRKFLFFMYTAGGQIKGWFEMNSFIRFFSFYFARIRCQEGKKTGWLEERGTDGEKVIHMHIRGIRREWKRERYTINTEYFPFSFTE